MTEHTSQLSNRPGAHLGPFQAWRKSYKGHVIKQENGTYSIKDPADALYESSRLYNGEGSSVRCQVVIKNTHAHTIHVASNNSAHTPLKLVGI